MAGRSVVFLCAGWLVPAHGLLFMPRVTSASYSTCTPQPARPYPSFVSVTFADVSLTAASHVTEPRVSLGGHGPGSECCGPVRRPSAAALGTPGHAQRPGLSLRCTRQVLSLPAGSVWGLSHRSPSGGQEERGGAWNLSRGRFSPGLPAVDAGDGSRPVASSTTAFTRFCGCAGPSSQRGDCPSACFSPSTRSR